jgi:hypothetical protein
LTPGETGEYHPSILVDAGANRQLPISIASSKKHWRIELIERIESSISYRYEPGVGHKKPSIQMVRGGSGPHRCGHPDRRLRLL